MNNLQLTSSYKRDSELIIITSLNYTYINMFDLWYKLFKELSLKNNLLVLSFDEKSNLYLSKLGINYQKAQADSKKEIFLERLRWVYKYLQLGYNVLHTDADAYWIDDNIFELFDYNQPDLAISIGHGIPRVAINKWGFSLCCGFFFIKNNKKTLLFLEKWINLTQIEMDDQVALNNMLIDTNFVWNSDSIWGNDGHSVVYDLSIKAIDYNRICRKDDFITDKTMVYHPYYPSQFELIKYYQALSTLYKNNLITTDEYKKRMYGLNILRMAMSSAKLILKKISKYLLPNKSLEGSN